MIPVLKVAQLRRFIIAIAAIITRITEQMFVDTLLVATCELIRLALLFALPLIAHIGTIVLTVTVNTNCQYFFSSLYRFDLPNIQLEDATTRETAERVFVTIILVAAVVVVVHYFGHIRAL